VLEREVKHSVHMLQRPMVLWQRKKNWPVSEAAGIKMVNTDFTNCGFIKNDSDVNQNAS
jgi:hypothetical protein